MKKTLFIAIAALVAFASCNTGGVPKADPKSELDTLSYQIGAAESYQMNVKDMLANMGIDSAYIDEFYKGLAAAAQSGDDKKLAAYYAGIQLGQYINTQVYPQLNQELFGSDSTQTVNLEQLLAGFIDGSKGKCIFTDDELRAQLPQRFDNYKAKTLEKKYGDYKKQCEAFMAKTAKDPEVKQLPGGTLYKVIKEGEGPVANPGDKVKVLYEGRLIDGTVFDSSANNNNQPTELMPSQVIPAWQEALKIMKEGSEWELYVPYTQGYGVNEVGQIKPFSTLIFKITLVKAKSDVTAEPAMPQMQMVPMN